MSQPVRTLIDVIDRARTKQDTTSSNALSRIAREAGFSISHTTLSSILKGNYPSRPNLPTLEALVYLSGLSMEEVQRAADVEPGVPYIPPEGAQYLTVKQREVVNGVIRALAEVNETLKTLSNTSADLGNTIRSANDGETGDEYPNEAVFDNPGKRGTQRGRRKHG